MAKIWRNRIVAGDKMFADCPERYRDAVLELLRADVASGSITADRFEELTWEQYDAD